MLQRLLCAGSGISVGVLIFERESAQVTLGLNPATGLPRLANKKKLGFNPKSAYTRVTFSAQTRPFVPEFYSPDVKLEVIVPLRYGCT